MLSELVAAIQRREISARELVEASLRRIEAGNAQINAVVLTCADRALEEASLCDARIARGLQVRPLEGVPILVKDIEDVAGLATTHGSLLFSSAPPATHDGLVPGRLRAAGAIVVGKTNAPEFAFEAYTSNRLFGSTRNPWGSDWSPGGSSGGSSAALAAGLAAAATSTDGGGSIRIPAALCGLVGLKPTNGIVGRSPIPSWMDLSTDGPIAQTISDIEMLLNLCKGPVDGDPSAVPFWEPHHDRPRRLLASPRTFDWGPVPINVAQAFDRALGVLETELSLPIELISPADICPGGNPDLDWFTICCTEQAHQLGKQLLAERAEDFDPVFLEYMDRGLATSLEDYLEARRRRFTYVRQMDELLGPDSVLVTPTLVTEGFLPDGRMTATTDPGVDPAILNTVLQNITGHPAITVPAGTLPNGLPFGLGLTAPRFHDGMLLDLAREWEIARPWPMTAPGYAPFAIGSL